jgi:hypothetical protein
MHSVRLRLNLCCISPVGEDQCHGGPCRELEQEATEAKVSVGIAVWRVLVKVVLVGIPLLLAIDGLFYRIGILFSPGLSFLAGPDIVLQIVGIVLSVVGLPILIVVGRKLAVNVYRLAVPERKLMTTGCTGICATPSTSTHPHPHGLVPREPELPRSPPLRHVHDAMGAEAPDVMDARGGGGSAPPVRHRGQGVSRSDRPGSPAAAARVTPARTRVHLGPLDQCVCWTARAVLRHGKRRGGSRTDQWLLTRAPAVEEGRPSVSATLQIPRARRLLRRLGSA